MISFLLATALLQDQPPIARFFPTTPGLKRRYAIEQDKVKTETSEEVMASVMVGEHVTTPVQSYRGGRKAGVVYYKLDGQDLQVAAYDPKKPLDPMRIIARSTPGKWNYDGEDQGFRLVFDGESKLGRRQVQGADREVLIVTIEAKLDEGIFENTISQTTVYAADIGLIEIKETRRTAKTKSERMTKLVSVEFPKTGGDGR